MGALGLPAVLGTTPMHRDQRLVARPVGGGCDRCVKAPALAGAGGRADRLANSVMAKDVPAPIRLHQPR